MFAKFEQLIEVPIMHEQYAERLLAVIIHKWNEEGDNEITSYSSPTGSGPAFVIQDEFDNVRLCLMYSDYDFIIELTDDSEGNDSSRFIYRIRNDNRLYDMIPTPIRNVIENSGDED